MVTSRTLAIALNAVSLFCLLSGLYFAVQFHNKPRLAWVVPLHLSYQKIGTVVHSHRMAHYDAEVWNHAIQLSGGIIAVITLLAFQRYRRGDGQAEPNPSAAGSSRQAPSAAASSLWNAFGFNFKFSNKTGLGTTLACVAIGSEVFSAPIGAVSTADITAELTRVPATTPWDMSAVMMRSAFERVTSQKPGGLAVTHFYIARHLLDGQGVRVGKTVYPTIRTHGVGVAPAPWERSGYRVPGDQARVLAYSPIEAATNVTVQCTDTTRDWAWGYEKREYPSTEEPDQPPTVIHRFHVYPKRDWHTRGPNRTATYIDGTRHFNLETWQALRKAGDAPDDANNMEIHQLFLITNIHPIRHTPKIILIDCHYGGNDVIRQVTMTSPIDPISISDILDTKSALDMEDLYPAASAIEAALGGDGGALIAGMAAAKITSLETWELLVGRTLELPGLLEHVLVDTAQAYFSLLRQWREEAQFFSWPRGVAPGQVPVGTLTATTRGIGWDGRAGVAGMVVLGLLALLPLTALMDLSRGAAREYRRRRFADEFELKDGGIKRKAD